MTILSGVFGPVSSNVTLNGAGYGTVQFQATGQQVTITNTSVVVSTKVKEASFTLYKNQIGDAYRLSGTASGSSGDNNPDNIQLNDGESIYGVWTGGDAGATATMTLSGTAAVNGGGFRAMG